MDGSCLLYVVRLSCFHYGGGFTKVGMVDLLEFCHKSPWRSVSPLPSGVMIICSVLLEILSFFIHTASLIEDDHHILIEGELEFPKGSSIC